MGSGKGIDQEQHILTCFVDVQCTHDLVHALEHHTEVLHEDVPVLGAHGP